jgi:predicted permease
LVVRSLSNLRASGAGFDRNHVVVFSIDPHVARYDSRRTWSLQQRLLSDVRNLPGVEDAALADRALMRGIGLGMSVVFPSEQGGVINCSYHSVSPEYFNVMKIHFVSGRTFAWSDSAANQKVRAAVVNEAFVRKFLSGRSPLGETFATGKKFVEPEYQIIGVVNDTKYRSLREIPPPILYANDFGPNAYPDSFILHVRTRGDPHAVIQPVRQLLKTIDQELPLYQVATVSEEIDHSLWQERLLASLTSCFAAFALSLSALGMYGILAYFVVRRRREIGLRMALGANSHHVIWLVTRRVTPILGIGVLVGALLAWLVNASLRGLLYGVQLADPWTNSAALLLLFAIGIMAAAAPVSRAIHLDPSATLRQE